MERNAYKELGVIPGADKETVRRAYLKLMRDFHPDLHPDDPEASEKCRIINMAYTAIKNGHETFLYTETDTKKESSNRDKKTTRTRYAYYGGYRRDYDKFKTKVINFINDLLFLTDVEKETFIFRIKDTANFSLVNDLLGMAERLNNRRKNNRNQIINSIKELEYLDQAEKDTFVSQLSSIYDMTLINSIWEKANKLNDSRMTIKQDAIYLIQSECPYLDDSTKERYISLITKTIDLGIIHQIVKAAKKEDTNNYNLSLLKIQSRDKIKGLFFFTTAMREDYCSYINNCINPDEINRVVEMAYSISPKYESLVVHEKNKMIKLYEKSSALRGIDVADFIPFIDRCHTIDEVANYRKALYIVEKICSNNIVGISIIDKICEAISNTSDINLRSILEIFNYELACIEVNQYEDNDLGFYHRLFKRKRKK